RMAAKAPELTTQDDVHKLPAPKSGETLFFDRGKETVRVSGLALRVRSAGSRRWYFYYRFAGKNQKKLGIGDASDITLDQARQKARQHRIKLADNIDPAIEVADKRSAAELTFKKVVAEYLEVRARDLRASSLGATKMHLEQHWEPLHRYPLASVTRAVVASQLRAIAKDKDRGPVAANRARNTLSAFFSLCIREGLCESNPVEHTNQN